MYKKQKGLINRKWELVEINGQKVILEENISQPYLDLSNLNEFTGNGGCNSMFGSYKISSKNFIEFSGIGMTERACAGKHYDFELTNALESKQQFMLVGEDEMRLHVGKRMHHAVFKAIKQ